VVGNVDEVDVLEVVDNNAVDAIISIPEFIVVVVGWFTRGRFVAGLFKDMQTIPEEEEEDEETDDDIVEAAGAERFWPIKLCDLLSSLDVAAGNDDFETAKDIIGNVITFGFLLSKAKGKGEECVLVCWEIANPIKPNPI
jgi:hypothetical protein